MELTDKIYEIEKNLDETFDKLQIWELPFQTIITMLLLTIDNIELNRGADTVMDYTSRLSYIFPKIKEKAANKKITTTEVALSKGYEQVCYVNDIIFINAYAHLCLLMPQIRSGVLVVSKIDKKNILLEYPKNIREAEIIDKLYDCLASQIIVPYRYDEQLKHYCIQKVKNKEHSLNAQDFLVIKEIYEHYCTKYISVKPLPNSVFETMTGVTYDEYNSFCAVVRAFSDFFISLGRANYYTVDKERNNEVDNHLMSKYFEWLVCCLDFKTLGWFSAISNVPLEKFDSIFGFYLQIYSNNTGVNFIEKSYCGEGYFPPFLLLENSLIYSPHACKYMLNINNIIYSTNKKQEKIFNDKISKHLEPTLIHQLEYIFSSIQNVTYTKNVKFTGSELDLIVFSEIENVAICIQVKSTIAPYGIRGVKRVTDRVFEGIDKQIVFFDNLSSEIKQAIINKAFNKTLLNTKIINILVVRSCAGSVKAWELNSKFRIINYPLLSWLIANKIEKGDFKIANIEDDITNAQNTLIKLGNVKEEYEKLHIGDFTIEFPNLNIDILNVVSMNLKSLKYLKKFEDD